MNKNILILFFALFFLSRILFINTGDVFFDSGENIDLFGYSNYFQALISGHFPPHEGYIMIFWPVFQLAKSFSTNPVVFVILGQIIMASIAVFCFYKVITFITDKKTAFASSVIVSLLPLFWITNVTIMMEIGYISFFFFSFYLLIKYLTVPKKLVYLHLAAACFVLSFITHMLIVLWLPLLLAVVFYKKKDELLKIFITFCLYLGFASILNVLFISVVSKESIPAVFTHLYLSKGNELSYLPLNFQGFLIAMRNFLLPLLRNNTSLVVILGFLSLILLFRNNKKLFIFGLLWVLPSLYTNQWWDSLLNGRHALITSFGFAFLTAYLIRNKLAYSFLVLVYLLFVSIPILSLVNKPIPYFQQAEFVKSLPKDSLLIETHFAKPQVERTFQGKLLAVNDPLTGRETIQKEIDAYLANKKPIFISSGALSEPYGLYSGPYLHNITLSYTKSFEMEPVITDYSLEIYKIIDADDNLLLYKIVSSEDSPYPNIKRLKDSHRRLDYYDPVARFTWLKI
jgi:hypothetical protein